MTWVWVGVIWVLTFVGAFAGSFIGGGGLRLMRENREHARRARREMRKRGWDE